MKIQQNLQIQVFNLFPDETADSMQALKESRSVMIKGFMANVVLILINEGGISQRQGVICLW